MADDVYLRTYRKYGGRKGGLTAVNDLINKLPLAADRVRVMEGLERTGRWEIKWHHTAREGVKHRDDGFVKAYLGRED
ncbi:hypothetical protein LB523_10525 [Mesorhizobium sp. ESP-6-4]|uniref:hypothetical protein n=1 Tax=Mesorhizobium sp. ESP-6-4 TaxID=2876624 RepID=UPI001CCA31C1|nr:hypothetical protein [Mesorhizobium sp. ESP-6-4]MBZ9659480.1 hypothetical protein [Mesorhizobium sp. ESP-6-4]